MQNEVKSQIERATAAVMQLVAGDVRSRGDDNISMAFLQNAFSAAIHRYVNMAGLRGQLSLLGEDGASETPLEGAAVDTRDVGSVVASAARAVLERRLEGRILDMCRVISRSRIVPTLEEASAVLSRAVLENDPALSNEGTRRAAEFAASAVDAGFGPDAGDGLAGLSYALRAVADRRRDRVLMERLGTSMSGIVRLTDRLSDLVGLHRIDPAALAAAIAPEAESSQPARTGLAA